MRGFGAFLKKEFVEIVRTWRVWVLPGIVLFFAVSGPPLAKVTPQLMESLMAGQEASGLVIQMPDPTYVDAYLQWTKNLAQLVLFAVIIMFGGMISSEKRSGTAALVMTKPLSRTAFVLAKFVSHAALVGVTVAIGALMTWGMTYAVFGEAPIGSLAQATGSWLVLALAFVGLMTLLSAVLDSQAAAAGLGFVAYMVLSVASLWGPALRYSPAGLVGAPTEFVMGTAGALGWPLATSTALAGVLVAVAVLAFRQREI